MNRIKHFMILALALAMSLGAWAQQEVLLTTVTATGETSYSQSPDGIVTVTLNIGFYDDYDYGWLGGTVTVEANQGYTITRCVFKQNTVSIADDLAPFTATLSGYSTDNVSVETSNGHVNGDADHMIGITSIEVYGHQADPSPTVTHNTDGSWGFTMPDYDAALNVTYYLQPNLAWTYNSAAMPAEGLTAYRGFELPVIGSIGAIMDHDFLTALLGGTVSLRYGSTNPAVISFTDPNDMHSVSVNGAGECNVYMVFDGNNDYQYDSVAFHAVIANPYTLTLAANNDNMGTVSALLGGATWTTETWANLPSDQNLSPLTFGDITISTTGSLKKYSDYNPGKLSFFVRKHDDAETLTFSSEGGNFTRIEMTMVSEYSQYNPDIIPADGWTFHGHTAVWEGDAPSVTVTSCSTYVDQITFTRGIDSIVASATEGQYLVIPGAEVQVVATAQDGNYVSAWSDNRQPQHYTSDTNTITVGESQTLTATFAQNPLLTLATDGQGTGTVSLDGDSIGTVYTFTFEHLDSPEDDRAITIPANRMPYDTTFSYNANIEFADAYDQAGESVSIIAHGDHTVTVRISGPFEYGGYYSCELEGGDHDDWTISCTTGTGPVTPNGITKTGDNTYRVLPGTQLSVTATPDSAHYLSAIGNEAVISNSAYNISFTMPDDDAELAATFTTKPTLTLAQTAGGTLAAIVPQGGVTAMHLTTDQIPTWSGNTEYAMAADLQQFGFVAVDSAAAAAWTGAPASGFITLVYALAGNQFKTIVFQDGQWFAATTFDFYKADFYTSPDVFYFTTGASKSNVIASSTPNTYYIDYGTPVTVVATPDAQHYLVSFSDDAPATERNSNIAVEKTYDSVIADIPLTATFQAKPTLTLAHNQGGEMEIVPAGGVTAIVPPTDQMDGWGSNHSDALTESDIPAEFGFVAVDQAAAEAWTGVPATGDALLIYGIEEETFYYVSFHDGSLTGNSTAFFSPGSFYQMASAGNLYITTGVTPGNVTASTEPNTYYIDYNTSVTVKATPSDTTYLVRFDQDADTNSNVAVEKTYGPLTAALTTAEATFNDKPVLTLAANDTTWGKVEIPIGLVATDPTPAPTPTEVANPVITGVLMPDGSMQVTMSCATQDADIYYTTDGVTSPLCDCPAAPEYHNALTITEPVTIMAAAYTGNDWSAVVTKTITLSYPEGIAQLTDSTYRVDYGTTVTVQADATELHHVKNWVDADSAAYPADSITYSDYAITTPQNLFPAKSAVTLTVTGDTMTKAIFGINSYDVFARVDTTEDVRGTVRAEYIDIDGVSQSVAADDTVTYTAQGGNLSLVIAIPTEPGYHFERWTDTLGTELGTNDTLEVTEAAAVIAVFDTNVYQISGTVAEGSEEWGEVTGSGDYRHFTQATLEAQPIEHYHFVRWEDGNTENPRVIDVVGPESHQAEFAIDRFIVSWSSNDEAMGHVVGPYDNHTTGAPIPRLRGVWGTTFQLVAQPAEHHMLDHWSTGATTNGITVTITENAEIVAYFKHVPYIVTVLSEDETMGTVAGTDTLEWQESTEISATANYGYHFTMWNDGVTDNPRTVVNNIESDQTFTASFAKNEYTVTVVSADETMGSVAGTDTVEYLDEIEISATANEHYHFVQWNDGETANPRTVSVTKNETYTATFAPNVYTLTLGINNAIMGTVALTAPAVTPNADGSYSIAYGTAVTVKGSASSRCFELGSWSDGAVVTADGSHSFSMAGNLVLTATFVNHLFRSDTVADVCDRFVWHGIAYTETPDVAPLHRLTTVDGCDSALVLNLTVRHSSTGVDEQVHCTPYTWIDGVTYSESNHTAQYILPGANAEQCDSIVTLDLTIGTQAESTEVVNACDSYEWHGVVYTETPAEAPTYTYHTLEGCDSTVTLQLTIGHPTEGIETIVACAPIEWHGTVYSESTDEPTWHTTNAAGCDSTVTLHLTIAPAIETEETVEACDEYEWHGVVYTETPAEAPTYTTVSVQGCDSTVTLHLTVNHSTAAVETVVACNSYEWHGVSYASSTTVPTYTTTGSNGCDSTTTLHLTINRSTSAVETVEACDSYEWHGTTYTVSTSLPTYTTEGSNGCDSTTTLNLTIKQSSRATETVVTCDEYEWHGVLFTETPVEAPTYTTEGSNGCDSTVTLNLTVNHSADVVETIGACAAIEWHGTVYSESTTEPTWHSTTVAGCDSTVTLHLTISDRIETEETVVACDSYEWHGVVYTASTDNATWSTTSIQGCDSTVTLHLTINRSTTGSETIEACESYEWHGMTYRQSGSYTFDTLNVAGCDSTVTLTLTLHQPTSGSEFVTTCGSYVWHEVTYTQSGAYVWHGTDVHGCDSTVTLLLTILQPVYSTENRTACNSYTWHGTEYSESGDYTWSTTAVSGCDSIVTLHLTINLPVTSDVEESACERYSWNGIVYSTSGDYVQTFTGVNGCDSTVTLHLTVNMPATETLGVTACDSYEWHEVTYTESGVYSWHGTTVAGCDSTATLNLTIGHSADTTISLQGEGSIVWNGETFTQSGTYERVIRTVLGCDSTVTLNLVILPEGFVMPYLYNIMDVVLTINHFQQGETNLQYHWYRWYRNGKMVAEGRAMDTYSEGGSKLNGVYYLEVAIDESLEYWVRSNEVTIGTVGIDEAEDIDFTVAPNPVMHGSTVSVAVEGADVQGAVISVYDVQGREVLRQQNSAFIEAPAASGMYMVRLTLNDGRTAVKRLIVK